MATKILPVNGIDRRRSCEHIRPFANQYRESHAVRRATGIPTSSAGRESANRSGRGDVTAIAKTTYGTGGGGEYQSSAR